VKILFICFSTLKFDVLTPFEAPLGGTESALAYLSVALAKLGHDISLMRNTEIDDTGTVIEGVRHLKISEDVVHLDPDVVIITSAPMAAPGVKKLLPRAKLILWNHMRPDQPAMQYLFKEEFRKDVDRIVYVSDTQKKVFQTSAKDVDGDVIQNAISPSFENLFTSSLDILETKQCRGAYTSTPYRGLAVLASVKEIPIDVYSSMQVYQGDDKEYEKMYEALKLNDCLNTHGSYGQSKLATALRPSTFLVYPSIFAECHSIAIIEAMAAGLKVITTDVAHEQTEFVDSLPIHEVSVESYTKLLRKNVNRFRSYPEEWAEKIWKQVQYVNADFTWSKRALEWEAYLQNLFVTPT
jgi:glycosyltransferase involved in cell wall biosynthesis